MDYSPRAWDMMNNGGGHSNHANAQREAQQFQRASGGQVVTVLCTNCHLYFNARPNGLAARAQKCGKYRGCEC